jgi:hypothetical protein
MSLQQFVLLYHLFNHISVLLNPGIQIVDIPMVMGLSPLYFLNPFQVLHLCNSKLTPDICQLLFLIFEVCFELSNLVVTTLIQAIAFAFSSAS